MALVDGLYAYAKCPDCGQICWTAIHGDDAQSCGCVCGEIFILNAVVVGTPDPTFTEAEMEQILENELAAQQ